MLYTQYFSHSLPGREALYDPGKRAGQMKMIREPQGVVAYTWVDDGENSHWEKVGDVLGGTDKDSMGKTTHEGKVVPSHICIQQKYDGCKFFRAMIMCSLSMWKMGSRL